MAPVASPPETDADVSVDQLVPLAPYLGDKNAVNHAETPTEEISGGLWHNPVVEFLRRRLSFTFWGRRYFKTLVEDTRTLARSLQDWKKLETMTPEAVAIETTNVCNANCVFCGYQHQSAFRKLRGVMSDEIFERTVHQCRELGVKVLDFTPLVGDALLDPKIVERLEAAKNLGFRVEMFTNGIRLERLDLNRIAKAVDSIGLSTAPFDAEHYRQIYRSGAYDRMLRGLIQLLETRNALDTRLEVNINFRSHIPFSDVCELPDFKDKILPLLREQERHRVYAQIRGFDSWGGSIQRSELPGLMDIATAPRLKHRPCIWTFRPIVLWDGKVRACWARFTESQNQDGIDGLVVGDLNSASLTEIWHGQKMRDLRRRFPAGELPGVCRSCTMYRSC